MIDTSKLSLDRELSGFLALETGFGTLAEFTSAHSIGLLGLPKASQPESFSDSEEKRATASLPQRFRDMTPAGSVSFSLYARPSGALGTPPAEAPLLKAATGIETINAGASVVYTPSIQVPSLSLAYGVGANLTQWIAGLVIEELKMSGGPKGAVRLEASGKCRAVLSAGQSETVADSTTTVLNLAAGGAKLFDVGARVQVGAENNAGAGYAVTAYDENADTITVNPALPLAPAAAAVVKGWLPTHSLPGQVLTGRVCPVLIDGVELPVTEWSVSLSRSIKLLDNVVNTADSYALQGYVADLRTVKASCKVFFEGKHLAFFRQAKNQARAALTLGGGAVAGQKMLVNLARCEVNTPELSGTAPLELPLEFAAFASAAGEDEIICTYQ